MVYYLIVSIILTAVFVFLFVADGKEKMKKYAILGDRISIISGAVLSLGSILSILIEMYLVRDDADFSSWIWDTSMTYYYAVVPVFIVLLAVGIISTLTSKSNKRLKTPVMHKLRAIMFLVSSVFILTLNYLAFIADSQRFSLHVFLLVTGVGFALLMRVASVVERKTIGNGEKI